MTIQEPAHPAPRKPLSSRVKLELLGAAGIIGAVVIAVIVSNSRSSGSGTQGGTDSCGGSVQCGSPAPVNTTNPAQAFRMGQMENQSWSTLSQGLDLGSLSHACQTNAQHYLTQGDSAAYNSYLQGCLNG
jgi:hypothetical protein